MYTSETADSLPRTHITMDMTDSYIGFDLGIWDHQIKGRMLEEKT